MPKASDPNCPLGFHPQVRWPNRCKRCFRDYGEHKATKELSGSTTSLNSLSSYDPNTNTFTNRLDESRESIISTSRVKEEVEGLSRSRSDLSADSLRNKQNEDLDYKEKGYTKLTPWSKSRPVSWSAQDLRQAVEEAKEQVRASREDLSRLYGSTKSLTQELGSLSSLTDIPDSSRVEEKNSKPTASFSSYLASRTRSPARPILSKSRSLQGTTSSTHEDYVEAETRTKTANVEHPLGDLRRTRVRAATTNLPAVTEGRISESANERPPKPPSRSRERIRYSEDNTPSATEERPRRIIHALRNNDVYENEAEVKSEDGSDASYVVQLSKPPKRDSSVTKRVEIDLQPEVDRLQKETKELVKKIQEIAERNQQLEAENKELLMKKPKFGDVRRQAEMSRMQANMDELNEVLKAKNKEIKDFKKEIEKRPLPKDVEKAMEDLRSKLKAAEQLCEELMDENEDYKKEAKTLEDEIEEMQDNFREDQADEYRDLKRELDQTAKNCRVLQFKLKKSERRMEQVSMKMHEEMEKMKVQLETAEDDRQKLKEKVADIPVKPGMKVSRSQVLGRQGSQDNTDQLQRDLQDSLEREQDLKEQLKFAEEESKSMRKKLSRLEEENETLALQLKKMSTKAKTVRQRSQERSGSLERSSSAERGTLSRQNSQEKPNPKEPDEGITEDLDPAELKIQLELNEQESAVLRRKVEELESENERLQNQIKEVMTQHDGRKVDASPPVNDIKSGNIIYDKKIKSLEAESSDLRKRLIEFEKENDQLKSDLDLVKKRAKITRSRSLEQADAEVKKKLESKDKESSELKTKMEALSSENDKLLDENKKLQLKVLKRLPLTSQENLYIDKQVLEDKLRRLERKLKDSSEKLKEAENKTSLIPEVNGDAGFITDKDVQIVELKKKIEELQEKGSLPNADGEEVVFDRTPKKPKDTTPKITLIKWVNELETECARLHSQLKFMEKEKTVLEEMSTGRRDSKNSVDGEMCQLLFSDCENLKVENQNLKQKCNVKENEVRILKRRLREIEYEVKKVEDKISKYKEDEKKFLDMINSEERQNAVVTEFTPKSALKKMVDDLNKECAKLHMALRENEKRGKKSNVEDISKMRELEDKLERERERYGELAKQLLEERQQTTSKDGKEELRNYDLQRYEDKLKELKKELAEEKEKYGDLKTQISEGTLVGFEELRAAQTEKHKAQKELSSIQSSMNVLEKRLKEAEETLRVSEKNERKLRNIIEKHEAKIEEEKNSLQAVEERSKEMTMSWLKERDEMKKELTSAKREKEKLTKELDIVLRNMEGMEAKLTEQLTKREEVELQHRKDLSELRTLRSENENYLIEIDDHKDTINRLEKEKEKVALKIRKEAEQLKAEKENLQIRMNTLESELKNEKRKRERLETEAVAGEKDKHSRLEGLKERLQTGEIGLQRIKEEKEKIKKDSMEQIKEKEKQIEAEKKNYDELLAKYELLEEDYVVQKAQYTMSNEGIEKDYSRLKKDYDAIESELQTLRETFNLRQDTWIKEKLGMQEQLRDLDVRLNRATVDSSALGEKKRLLEIIDDRTHQIEKLKRDEEVLRDQLTYHRKETEELRRQFEDLEKLQELNERRQASTVDTSIYESTIRELRSRLVNAEKTYKADSTKIKIRLESKVKALSDEVSTLSQHMTKYRRERDTYKEMLDGAQKMISELKGAGVIHRSSRADNANERAAVEDSTKNYYKTTAHLTEVQDLQSRITELEDKLADLRLENTKVKNEKTDVKAMFEIQICDLQSKLNEYEEDRLLGGAGRRVPGLRTRLELNWQKEREEQQRLIQETATLAKGLRETLYEVERERDMERLEAKRKIEQLKKTVDQENVDTKGKVQELQRDLLELREAHAKLRQINEKLRREKDRTEVEREVMRDKFLGSSREHLNQQTKMETLVAEMRKVRDLAPLVLGEAIDGRDPTISNLPGDPKPKTKEEFTEMLKKVNRNMEDLYVMMGLSDDRDRIRRAHSFRRALSIESDDEGGLSARSRSATRAGVHKGMLPKAQKTQLHRKAQSLDNQIAEDKGKIWVSTDAGSTSSIDSALTDDLRKAKFDRDASLDRISTGSQTSNASTTTTEKKSKGIKGVFSKLGKSRSIEDTNTGESIAGAGLKAMAVGVELGTDIPSDTEKDTVKNKIKTLFKKDKTSSRTKSVERDGPSVKQVANRFDSDTASVASKPVERPPRNNHKR